MEARMLKGVKIENTALVRMILKQWLWIQ